MGTLFWYRLIFAGACLGAGLVAVFVMGEGFSREHLIGLGVAVLGVGWWIWKGVGKSM
ncbi:hypothetical protein ACN2XU_05730 [Primorskyibacter sp. 2E107]|uniref:hypothetical protein n=1 Tax=Primorskyibacter sp. 2E107 TaxID=3403458 RepID=UPI003AF56473